MGMVTLDEWLSFSSGATRHLPKYGARFTCRTLARRQRVLRRLYPIVAPSSYARTCYLHIYELLIENYNIPIYTIRI